MSLPKKPSCAAAFRLPYVLFVIQHGHRPIMHFGVTEHPTATWVSQQLRGAFPFDTAPRHLIFDRDSTFSAEGMHVVKGMEIAACSGVGSVRV